MGPYRRAADDDERVAQALTGKSSSKTSKPESPDRRFLLDRTVRHHQWKEAQHIGARPGSANDRRRRMTRRLECRESTDT